MGMKDDWRIDEIGVTWPFGCFWAGLNAQLQKDGYSEARYNAAREAWAEALDTAKRAIKDHSTPAMGG